MTGYLLAMHGDLAEGFMSAISLILGPQEHVITMGLKHEDSIDEFSDTLKSNVEKLGDNNNEVIIFVDLLGASPYNAAVKCVKLLKNIHFRVVTGTNLGMLIETFMQRLANPTVGADDIADLALRKGKEGINELFKELEVMQKNK